MDLDNNSSPTPSSDTPAPTSPPAAGPASPSEVPPPTSASPSPATGEDPGKLLGIFSLVFSFFAGLVGLILGIIAKKKSKAAGFSNGLATAGIIISIINILIGLVVGGFLAFGAFKLTQTCSELGPGRHVKDGVVYRCS